MIREAIIAGLPWVLSAITIYMTVLAGNRHRWAWAVGLAAQALWLVWIVASASWGLLPMNLALWIVYGRNHLKWRASALVVEPEPMKSAMSFCYCLLGQPTAEAAARVWEFNPEERMAAHRAIYERRPQPCSYDQMMREVGRGPASP